ncbi:hypothetical protein CAP35_13230 [Chitinophagaceae bacterium IBVUCB1]|nr:hypothetical protein CAP35_13230 [Chitinophagaceae bacterium IBVUCB1]
MKINKIIFLLLTSASLFSCRKPKPLDIAIPQRKDEIVLSSMLTDGNTLLVAAGYSVEAISNINEETANTTVPKNMLIDSGLVTLTPAGGGEAITLTKVSAGMYGSRNMALQPGQRYTLRVTDLRKGLQATATTTLMPQPSACMVAPAYQSTTAGDTLYKLQIDIPDTYRGAQYFVSYTTSRQLRQNVKLFSQTASQNLSALTNFEPKQIELLQSDNDGQLSRSISVRVSPRDTLIVQVARIDDGYYKYLQAYKRTGYLINQLTGEPINLPTNIEKGHGYFSLAKPYRFVFDMQKVK